MHVSDNQFKVVLKILKFQEMLVVAMPAEMLEVKPNLKSNYSISGPTNIISPQIFKPTFQQRNNSSKTNVTAPLFTVESSNFVIVCCSMFKNIE